MTELIAPPIKTLAARYPFRVAVTAVTLAVADMIGIGVFTSLAFSCVGPVAVRCPSCSGSWAASPRLPARSATPSFGDVSALGRRIQSPVAHLNPAVGFLAGWVSATVALPRRSLGAMAFGTISRGGAGRAAAASRLAVVCWFADPSIGRAARSQVPELSTFIKLGLIVVLT